MVVGDDASTEVAGFHGLPADDQRNFHLRVPEPLQFVFNAASLIAAGPVFKYRFIGRWVYGENRIGHAQPPF
jgi:hypothetical protein